jgi:hypothetical protein
MEIELKEISKQGKAAVWLGSMGIIIPLLSGMRSLPLLYPQGISEPARQDETIVLKFGAMGSNVIKFV